MSTHKTWIEVAKESFKEGLDPGMAGLESQCMQFASTAALIAIAEILAPLVDDLWDDEFEDDVDDDSVWVKRAGN